MSKNKNIIAIILVILVLVCGLIFILSNKNKKDNTQDNTTVTAIEDENHEMVKNLLNKYLSGGFTGYDNCLKDDVDENITIKDETGRNYAKVRGYASYEKLTKDLCEVMSETLVNEIPKDKFIEKDGILYCYYPQTSYPLFNNDIKINKLEVKDDSMIGIFSYTTGDGKSFEVITYNKQVSLIKHDGIWIINNITSE